MPRTQDEQRFWDELSKEIAKECVRAKGFRGCAHLVRDFADDMLIERRRSVEQEGRQS